MKFLEKLKSSKAGQTVLVVTAIGALILVAFECRSLFGPSAAAAVANERTFICSETMKSFPVNLSTLAGQSLPVQSPYSGKRTGYPAELCYWTSDGHVKTEPTPVLLNSFVGKLGPTFCPDCGRLVIAHNPMAQKGATPPPTRAEWTHSRGQSR